MKTRFLLFTFALLCSVVAWAQSTDPLIDGYIPIGGTESVNDENYPMLVDGDKSTKWCVTHAMSRMEGCFIEFRTEKPIIPTGYVLTTGNDCADSPGRNPKDWVIKAKKASSDEWTTIATVTNDGVLQDINFADYEFTIDNTEAYKYFRFEVTALKGSTTFQLAEFQFRGNVTSWVFLQDLNDDYVAQDGQILMGTLRGPYKISIAENATVVLCDVEIRRPKGIEYQCPGITCLGSATLKIWGTNTVEAFGNDYPAIYVPPIPDPNPDPDPDYDNYDPNWEDATKLFINGGGTLNVIHYWGAGIGGGRYTNCGSIDISDVTINATGRWQAAAIGCGYGDYGCDRINITGSTITAESGIGLGAKLSACLDISISYSTVNVSYIACGRRTYEYPPSYLGIYESSDISIINSNITVTGDGSPCGGIGCGDYSWFRDIFIENSTVTVKNYAIGCGMHSICNAIRISGSTVNASTKIARPAIGCGEYSYCEEITIHDDNCVTATTTRFNSIGAGRYATCKKITIGGVETGSIDQNPFVTYPYTVSFNANGGTGEMADKRIMYNVPQPLPDNAFTRDDGAFICWNTESDGSGSSYGNKGIIDNLTPTKGETIALYAQWQGNDLTDGTPYKVTQDGPVASASYTKTLDTQTVGKYQPWLVPFDYTITAADMLNFSFYGINMIANATKPGEGNSDEIWVFLTRLGEGDILHGNSPYVYKPKQAVTDYKFIAGNTILRAKSEEAIAKMETMEDIYSIYGIYANTTPDEAFYSVNNGRLILTEEGSDIIVPSLQWIMCKESKFGDTSVYVPEIRFFGEDIDATTGIDEIGQQTINKQGSTIFNLSGQRLNKMQKGVNIVGSKKIIIR